VLAISNFLLKINMVKGLAYFNGLDKKILEFISGKFCQLSGSEFSILTVLNPRLQIFVS
jgi:hypothetical protein